MANQTKYNSRSILSSSSTPLSWLQEKDNQPRSDLKSPKSKFSDINFDDFFCGKRISPFSLPRYFTSVLDETQLSGSLDMDATCLPARDKPVVLFKTASLVDTATPLSNDYEAPFCRRMYSFDRDALTQWDMQEDGVSLSKEQYPKVPEDEKASNTGLVSLIKMSGLSSNSFTSFQRRLGHSVHSKYCSDITINVNFFLFIHVVYGIVQCILGILAIINSPVAEVTVGIYMTIGGILNALLFPILLMEWGQRIGGCSEENETNSGKWWWPITLGLRLIDCVTGAVLIVGRFQEFMGDNLNSDLSSNKVLVYCSLAFVIGNWLMLGIAIMLPIACQSCLYLLLKTMSLSCEKHLEMDIMVHPNNNAALSLHR